MKQDRSAFSLTWYRFYVRRFKLQHRREPDRGERREIIARSRLIEVSVSGLHRCRGDSAFL